MKRLIDILIIAFVVPLVCIAAPTDPPDNYSKKIIIQGGYDSVASISVDPIPIQSQGFLMGMPFPLDDPSAQYGASERGRQIAKWHVLTNDLFVLDIDAEILHNYSENNTANSGYDKGLGYKLTFTYLLSYKSGNQIFNNEKSFSIDVPVSPSTKSYLTENINILSGVSNIDPNSLVGSAEGAVFFSFDAPTSAKIKSDYDWFQDGNYNAVVKMILRVKDKE